MWLVLLKISSLYTNKRKEKIKKNETMTVQIIYNNFHEKQVINVGRTLYIIYAIVFSNF